MKKIKNNSGFSLVELIIVIAIMAVLVGLLAPQYIKYVERSKIQKVITNTETVANAITVVLTDAAAFETDAYTTLLKLANDSNPLDLSSDEATFLREAVDDDIEGEVTFHMSDDETIIFTYTMKDGRLAVDYNYTDPDHEYVSENGSYHVYYANATASTVSAE